MASRKEDIDPRQEKRPARRYYRLTATATGAVKAGEALTKARRPSRTALRGPAAPAAPAAPARRGAGLSAPTRDRSMR
ncbi:hypothetical protein A6A28_33325 [Streptomyces sp. CB03578]|uniref:hypothetical protein n=1 Tax=Streptomyces sp. CB03578 TaxID=1718987 RepID=UPI000939A606|nr:hypothetical protein [Streptomyces sp. CB03578]OKI37039.1 hypothetical protein A6A28_33325 [Streptomyces sp. CB03578]